ncbi:hypothetical protein FB566_4557 [Stackebrandtia endophytica]|uniref:DUF308 domain-containing protein n=1 Tax=Stackebrandtia endophytica TaxID=1496996 RepID=A0A543B291_9ACTN|nr:hypothetical protein [Stackebrandtia endophytica]TQL78959.1 hypothetical protein FB566_4557 [Stackebrandtia endophytica]
MSGSRDEDGDRPADESAGRRDEHDLDAAEVDQRFAELIAGIESPVWPDSTATDRDESPPESVPESASEPGGGEPELATAGSNPRGPDKDDPTLLELWDAELPDDPDDEEETFTPPPPGPLPKPSLPAILGVLLVVGGLFLVLYPTVLDVGEDLGRLTGIAGFVGGAAMLIWRLRPEPDEDDEDPDNGAVV